jgi:hypothetical protein
MYTANYLAKETFEGFGEFNIEGHVIRTVKYIDDFVLLAKEETAGLLQGKNDRIIDGKTLRNGNVGKKTKVMRISRFPHP